MTGSHSCQGVIHASDNGSRQSLKKKTQKSTAWGLKIWSDWAEHSRKNLQDDEERRQNLLTDFVRTTISNMNFWLCRFVAEARRVDGQPYPPNTLYQICCVLIPRFFINHSLRTTAETRLFDAGVDEQLIMKRAGHRSVAGVPSYKRVTDDLNMLTSSVLNDGS